MTASYTSTLPTEKDKLRLLIGDTSATFAFQDEELYWFLSQTDQDLYSAAVDALEAWAAKMGSRPVSYSRGGVSVTRSPQQLRDLADMYRNKSQLLTLEVLTAYAYDSFTLQRIIQEKILLEEIT